MAQISKIEKYSLNEFVLTLAGEGKTGAEIATILNNHIKKNLKTDDSITQPSVSRWLKQARRS